MPVWRRGHDNRPYSLRITKAGLRAIEVEDLAEAPENNAMADPNAVAAADVSTEARSTRRPSRAKRSGAKNTAAVSAKPTRAWSDQVKPDSKQDRIVALLQSPERATLEVLVKETHWQKQSLRGFLPVTL